MVKMNTYIQGKGNAQRKGKGERKKGELDRENAKIVGQIKNLNMVGKRDIRV
jgi:hypothetical protein